MYRPRCRIWRGFTEREAHWSNYLGDFVFYKAHFFVKKGKPLVQTVIMFHDGDECMVQQAFFTRAQYDFMVSRLAVAAPVEQEHISVSLEGHPREDFPHACHDLSKTGEDSLSFPGSRRGQGTKERC